MLTKGNPFTTSTIGQLFLEQAKPPDPETFPY
ncbi:hypothetical protein LIER_03326 [Lithospermum erythrorhizon]|uniref:Uncharacterized protein n=1 Tax=Lithospermum erythrorhizon TaxID=34254 RepID=A0AAV3NUD4_LITER